jgi:hypothetical protein
MFPFLQLHLGLTTHKATAGNQLSTVGVWALTVLSRILNKGIFTSINSAANIHKLFHT